MNKIKLADMTWVEIKQIIEERHPAAIVPIGTTETQGMHIPTGYDHFIAEEVSYRAAKKCNAVVAPTICYGYSELFCKFPGTLTLKPETLQNLIYDITVSLINTGFTHIVFMNNHDPNTAILGFAMQRIRKKFGLVMPALWPTNMARNFAQDQFIKPSDVLLHGNEPGTSLSLALFPEKVRMDLAEISPIGNGKLGDIHYGSFATLVHEGQKVPFFSRCSDVSQSGAYGYPKEASSEIGIKIINNMIDFTATFIDKFLETDNRLGE